jgi:hypothetical protein
MATITPGRTTADVDGKDVVVFLIGMRVNKLWKIHKWAPVAVAMPRMLMKLFKQPDLGMLDARTFVSGRTVLVVQYWESFEKLEHFARSADEPHLEAWRRFNAKIGKNGDVGIFHETYTVPAGHHECIYANMPAHGLSKAYGAVPVGTRGHSAKKRLAGTEAPDAAQVPDDVALPVY